MRRPDFRQPNEQSKLTAWSRGCRILQKDSRNSGGKLAMDPNAVHDPEPEHDHEHKRAAVTDQGQRHARDWQHRDRHAHVLKDMREDEGGDANDEEETELIAREKGNEETRHEEQGKPTNEKHA